MTTSAVFEAVFGGSGTLFGLLGMENWTAWQELRFGVFRFFVAFLIPELQ